MIAVQRWCAMCVALYVGLPPAAQAQPVDAIDPARSEVTFVATQMGVPAQGGFKRFTARVQFDPARLSASKAQIEIELDSIDTGVAEVDTEVKRKAWFNTAQFPTATFVSTAVRSLGASRYEATGRADHQGPHEGGHRTVHSQATQWRQRVRRNVHAQAPRVRDRRGPLVRHRDRRR